MKSANRSTMDFPSGSFAVMCLFASAGSSSFASCSFHLLKPQQGTGEMFTPLPFDLVQFLDLIPLSGVPGAAEIPVAVII